MLDFKHLRRNNIIYELLAIILVIRYFFNNVTIYAIIRWPCVKLLTRMISESHKH